MTLNRQTKPSIVVHTVQRDLSELMGADPITKRLPCAFDIL
jgi:hypothetical protein